MAIRNNEDAQRVLRHVSDEQRFYCHDGSTYSNIHDLKTGLDNIHEQAYRHHVAEKKNDFARWVREVLGDDKLAKDLSKAPDKKEAARIVAERITWLQARA